MQTALPPDVRDLLEESEDLLHTRIAILEDPLLTVAGTTAVLPNRPNYGKILVSPRYRDCAAYVVGVLWRISAVTS